MTLTTNLISYWKLDGNSTDSVGSNNGTDTAITYSNANGKINNGAGGNGTSSLIDVGTSSTMNITGALTLTAWIKLANFTNYNWIISRLLTNGGTSSTYELRIEQTSGKVNLLGPGTNSLSVNAISTGVFVFVCATRDASNNTVIYINGTQDNTGTSAAATSLATQATVIGTRDDRNSFLGGALDEIGIWSRALTGAEVTSLYNGGVGLQYPFTVSTVNGGFFNFM